MNVQELSGWFRKLTFRASRAVLRFVDGGQISAFGEGQGKIGLVLIVNLNRQPHRLRRTMRELSRFRTSEGVPLTSIAKRLAAVDARDGCAIAATADVEPTYLLSNQLYVQPDAKLEDCFPVDEPIRMTRQEIAVARSHIEAWKFIVRGTCNNVLVVEDDIWFTSGAASAIDDGWNAASERCLGKGGPSMMYLSYEDAGGTATRADVSEALFRPIRGLWFLSGYVLSREGAAKLLRSMPVVGPVDMWINYRFGDLGALSLSLPAIKQRPDEGSGNSYSILPYLARAGIVDANAVEAPCRATTGPVFAWTSRGDRESLPMALSMLGRRVRAFDSDEKVIQEDDLSYLFETFDAFIDAPMSIGAIQSLIANARTKFVIEEGARNDQGVERDCLPPSRTVILPKGEPSDALWQPLCSLLDLDPPIHAFPVGPPRAFRIFRDDRSGPAHILAPSQSQACSVDDSPWALIPETGWPSKSSSDRTILSQDDCLIHATMTTETSLFPSGSGTFPGNLAAFDRAGLVYDAQGANLKFSKTTTGSRPYRSGSFASVNSFGHGRFESEIKAARGSGLVTGFFLHRDSPRQEIDIELTGDDMQHMLVNVYFNPGDDGAAVEFGYRGSPCRIELGFDASLDFHLYAIDWRPGCISWSVDGRTVHERVGWEPTPLPHLPMHLHANLWASRSEELAGRVDENTLPAEAVFRNVSIWANHDTPKA